MVGECWVILIVLGIAAYMFVRRGRRAWAPGVLPLMLVPFVNIIYSPIGRKLGEIGGVYEPTVRVLTYIFFLVVACVWMMVWAKKLPTGRSRYAYVLTAVGFTLIFVLLLIHHAFR